MARYLLNAPDEDMAEWKRLAKEWGIPFARFLRLAANFAAQNPSDALGAPAPKAGMLEPKEDQGFRIVKPDWKRGQK